MKHLKTYENHKDKEDIWEEIQDTYDVYQLMQILVFKYAPNRDSELFNDVWEQLEEYDDDYNPDHIYETIRWVLEQNNLFDDFIENYQQYSIERDENDPYHWRYQKKKFKDLGSAWD